MFRFLPVADAVFRIERLPAALVTAARDTISLSWEERTRTRARLRSDGGIEFGTSLPRGSILRDGDCLALENPSLVVVVRERAEPVFVMRPSSPEEWALWGYHLGNSHQPVMITADGLVCPEVPEMQRVLEYHRIPFTREVRAFTPVLESPGHPTDR